MVYAIGACNVELTDTGYFVIRTESDAGHDVWCRLGRAVPDYCRQTE